MRVRVETVQCAHAGKADIAEHVLGDQRRPQQQDRVCRDDREHERAHRQCTRAREHEQIARAHDQRQRLKAPGVEAHVQTRQRACQPRRPAATACRYVLRRFAGCSSAREEYRRNDAEQAEQPECAGRARVLAPHAVTASRSSSVERTPGASRRARRGRGGLHRLIVTSSRREAYGGKCRIPAYAHVTLAGGRW